MRLSRFTPAEIEAGNELLSAYDAVNLALDELGDEQDRVLERRKANRALSHAENLYGERSPQAHLPVDESELFAQEMAGVALMRHVGISDRLGAIIEKYDGHSAYVFPKNQGGTVYLGQSKFEASPERNISGRIMAESQPFLTALTLTSSGPFRAEKTQHVLMIGEFGACALAHVALVKNRV